MNGPWTMFRWGLALTCCAFVSACETGPKASFDPIELALLRAEPADGESSVARNRLVRLIFNTDVLPGSVTEILPSGRTWPVATMSKRCVAWLYERK